MLTELDGRGGKRGKGGESPDQSGPESSVQPTSQEVTFDYVIRQKSQQKTAQQVGDEDSPGIEGHAEEVAEAPASKAECGHTDDILQFHFPKNSLN